jgi:hypothetical protein
VQLGKRLYLGAREGLAESHSSEILWHDRFLLYLGDGANTVVNFILLQLIGGHPCWVTVIGILPHAVGSSGEWLHPAFNEGANELNARQLLLGRGPKFLDPLHERLGNLHFFGRQLVFPRRPGSKIGDGLKFFKPEILASGRLVLSVEPLRPPPGVVFRGLEVEVGDVRVNLTAKAAGLELQRAPDDEDSAPERPMGFDPQEAFA